VKRTITGISAVQARTDPINWDYLTNIRVNMSTPTNTPLTSLANVLIEPPAARQAITPIVLLTADSVAAQLATLSRAQRAQLNAQQFKAVPGAQALLLNADGELESIVCVAGANPLYALAKLSGSLAPGDYQLSQTPENLELLALGFALGTYQFTRYKAKAKKPPPRLVIADVKIRIAAAQAAHAIATARDLVNTPTEDLGPAHLSQLAADIAKRHGGSFREIVGEQLLTERFPAIHAVGRASHRDPRLIELSFGEAEHPLVVLVGKGVCFDTGGLDIKASDGMALMKKDMGGAAVALALTELILQAGVKIRLKLLIPAVENAIGPNAYRPGEIIATRAGLSVEIGNTDAEGRVILCDALTYAAEFKPALIIDFATLTGAARIALGPDLPATFSNQDDVLQNLLAAGKQAADPLWPMPLWHEYQRLIDSPIADLNNAGSSRMGGAITAALYLEHFIPNSQPWVHVDTYCWNDSDRPGRPRGGECQSLRAVFQYLQLRFGSTGAIS
jgi:leucyl aminopeptidase